MRAELQASHVSPLSRELIQEIDQRIGRDEQAMFVTIAGILVALMLLVTQIRDLFDLITSVFGM